jgi:hypothetical protein
MKKYENLKSMLRENYSISLFDDDSIVEEYILLGTENYAISVFVEGEEFFQIVIERKNKVEDRWEEVEERRYITTKPAYKFIKSWMDTIKVIEE